MHGLAPVVGLSIESYSSNSHLGFVYTTNLLRERMFFVFKITYHVSSIESLCIR